MSDPSATLESSAAVLVRPAESLHHAVDGDHRDGRQFHDRGSLLLGAPSWAASHPCYEHLGPDPTPPPGFLSRTFWYAGCKRSDSATVSGRLRSTSSCARPVRTSSGTRSIAKTLTSGGFSGSSYLRSESERSHGLVVLSWQAGHSLVIPPAITRQVRSALDGRAR